MQNDQNLNKSFWMWNQTEFDLYFDFASQCSWRQESHFYCEVHFDGLNYIIGYTEVTQVSKIYKNGRESI